MHTHLYASLNYRALAFARALVHLCECTNALGVRGTPLLPALHKANWRSPRTRGPVTGARSILRGKSAFAVITSHLTPNTIVITATLFPDPSRSLLDIVVFVDQ